MGEILTAIMRWVHLSSVVTLIGGIVYARWVMIPAARFLSPEARTGLDESAAQRFRPAVIAAAPRSLPPEARTALAESAAQLFRPAVFAAIAGLVISGIFNYLSKPGHSVLYHALFGIKMLLALHVFSMAILVTAPQNPRRARQLSGAAISGLAILLIAAYLKGIA